MQICHTAQGGVGDEGRLRCAVVAVLWLNYNLPFVCNSCVYLTVCVCVCVYIDCLFGARTRDQRWLLMQTGLFGRRGISAADYANSDGGLV